MDVVLELIKEAPLVVIIGAVALVFLPTIAKILECLCGFILNLVVLFMKRKDIQHKGTSVRINFRGIELEIGQLHLTNEENAEDDGEDDEETLLNDLSKKIIDIKKGKRK